MKKFPANKKLIGDLALIAFLLLLSALLFLFYFGKHEQGAEVAVRVDGVETARYSLSQNGRYELNGGTNILVIEDGCAYMLSADCPDELCVGQGKIMYTGQCITCLPNRLTVTVYGAEDSGIDLVSG